MSKMRTVKSETAETIKMVLQALAIALVIRTLFFQPFNIPSGSLIPTLLVGDYLFVSKYSYGYSRYSIPFSPPLIKGRIWGKDPLRGDVAVFRNVKSPNGDDYIKRVIGLPGDRVQMIDGILHINGEAVKREATGVYPTIDAFGNPSEARMYRETLPNGFAHTIIEREGDRSYWDNTVEYKVPEGHFFMMGDNRDNSTDSRDLNAVGYVHRDTLIGRAEVIFFSFGDSKRPLWEFWNWPLGIRFERIFQGIQ